MGNKKQGACNCRHLHRLATGACACTTVGAFVVPKDQSNCKGTKRVGKAKELDITV